jgi:alkaline phosphatase
MPVRCVAAGLIGWLLFIIGSATAATPRNVVFMVGDGMGLNHASAAGMYLNGTPGTLAFQSLPHQALVRTYSADSSITDSAAAATAMATGTKVNNGVIAMATPGDGRALQSLLEYYKARGAATGLVTSDAMTGATPGAFGAHEPDRNNASQIAGDYLAQSRPNVLLGGGGSGMSVGAAQAAGYTVVTDRAGLLGIDTGLVTLLSGQFGSGSMPYEYDGAGSLPHLRDMAAVALDMLGRAPGGFFLLIEGGNIDHAAHANDIARDVQEVLEFNRTVQVVLDWAAGRSDTLVIVTADHETGGLSILQNNGQGKVPTVTWSTTGHSGVNVGAWAWGVNAEYVAGTLNNTQYFQIITNPQPAIAVAPAQAAPRVVFGHNPPPGADSFTLTNAGLGSYTYTIASDAAWVRGSPDAGECSSEADTIQLVYDAASLPVGTYVAHLTISSPGVPNSPQLFTVSLQVDPVPADVDGDGDVDQEDYARVQLCLAGSETVGPECQFADLNRDHRVDGGDVGLFARCLSGPGLPVIPTCAD